jgi:hypothetical protein
VNVGAQRHAMKKKAKCLVSVYSDNVEVKEYFLFINSTLQFGWFIFLVFRKPGLIKFIAHGCKVITVNLISPL